MRLDVQIPTPDGRSHGTLHVPGVNGPWPGALVFPDAGGARETFRRMGDRLASMGYAALIPDIYYRAGEWAPFDVATVFTDQQERARLAGLASGLTNDRMIADSGAYADFLLARPEVTGSAVGVTGYCLGGRMSLIAAGGLGGKIAAAASFHGGRLAVAGDPSSPHLSAGRIAAAVYVAGAQDDDSFTAEQAGLLACALAEAGVDHTLEFYPARHGFAVPDNPTYDAEADARHWEALRELYRAHLPDRMLDLDELDLEEIALALGDQIDYEHWRLINPETGEIVFWTSDGGIDGQTPVDLDDLDLLVIRPLPAYVWYQDMADFAEDISDERAGRRLARAIEGRGAFRRFKDELHEEYPHLLPAWYAFRDTRALRRAVEWLADNSLIDHPAAARFMDEHPDPDLP